MNYKKANEQSLGSVIREFLKAYRIEGKVNEARLINSWEKIVGQVIAKHTVNLRIQNRKLFVEVDSAALRNELTYAREKIKKTLNQEAGEQMIDEVIFR